MGSVASKVGRKLVKPVKDFNIEARVEKVISKDKPSAAPRHASTKKVLDDIAKDHPEILEELKAKNQPLLQRLKDVYVVSTDPEVEQQPQPVSEDRPLPLERKPPVEPEFGYLEPTMIPRGRFSLRQALEFIGDHQQDPQKWTAAVIAKKHTLDEKLTEKVLRYFRTFELYIPPDDKPGKKPTFAAPSRQDQVESGGNVKIGSDDKT